ncbi:MAG: cyclase family protein [Anaerolineae bacterium]
MVFNIDWQRYRLVDLSYEVIPGASTDRYFNIERGLLADNAFMHHVRTHTHVGTHVEVAAHFYEGGRDITAYDLERFMGRGLLLDIIDAVKTPLITAETMEAQLGALMGEGDIIICRNSDPQSLAGNRPVPALTPEAARWIAAHKAKMVGIDTHFSLGVDVAHGRELHDILMSADITLVEFLANLEQLKRSEFYFMALPYKCRTIDSGWARAVAIEKL